MIPSESGVLSRCHPKNKLIHKKQTNDTGKGDGIEIAGSNDRVIASPNEWH